MKFVSGSGNLNFKAIAEEDQGDVLSQAFFTLDTSIFAWTEHELPDSTASYYEALFN